jgi:hypothetical protein
MPIQPDPDHQPRRRGASPVATLDPDAPPTTEGENLDEPVELVPPPNVDELSPGQLAALGLTDETDGAGAQEAAEQAAAHALATAEAEVEVVDPAIEQTDRYRDLVRDVVRARATETSRRNLADQATALRRQAESELGEFARGGYGDPAGVLRGTGIKVTNRTRRPRAAS